MTIAAKTPTAKSPAPKHAVKRQALLDEAAHQINMRGAGAVSLNAIAETVGLSRNALYYYITDRADLAFRCYLRSCETATEDLAFAYEQGGNAVERLSIYVERTLTFDRPAVAVLSDQDFLPEPQRSTIIDLNRRNVETLENIISDGIRDQELRPVHAEIAAQALIGMMNWVKLSSMWLGHRDGPAVRRKAAAAILALYFDGLASGKGKSFACTTDARTLIEQPFNIFDRAQATQQKMNQLIGAASRLFNRRGIDGASLDDISASVGATKGAVYHYFDDKTDLVVRCYDRAFELYDLFMDTAKTAAGSGFEQSMRILHLNCQAQASATPPLMLQPGLLALPQIYRERFITQSQTLWREAQKALEIGVDDGSCTPCDPGLVAEVSAGSFLWIQKWLPHAYEMSPMQIADAMCDLLASGIRR
jgi:AcrR family transcriptional regulator